MIDCAGILLAESHTLTPFPVHLHWDATHLRQNMFTMVRRTWPLTELKNATENRTVQKLVRRGEEQRTVMAVFLPLWLCYP